MLILGIDSSASPVSCALMDNGRLKGECYINTKITHSQTLMPLLHSMLNASDTAVSDIDAFAVSSGPGSFTGIRIGISAIKGLALPSDKPCISVSTLEAMAYNFVDIDSVVIAGMDARCNQVYNAIFEVNDGKVSRLCEDRAIMLGELKKEIEKNVEKYQNKTVFVVGDGADLVYNNLKELLPEIKMPSPHLKFQNAHSVLLAANEKIEKGETVSSHELSPVYLRLPQAERELKLKKEKENV